MYYIMQCHPPTTDADEALLEIHNDIDVGDVYFWNDGLPLPQDEKQSIPKIINIHYDVFQGYNGLPPDMEDLGVSIMSERLKDALDSAGINNIEYFPATLINNQNGEKHQYFAFSLVGLVAIADMSSSDYESFDGNPVGDVSFYELKIDETKAKGLPIFRLAEDSSAIMVHESIKKVIEEAGIDTIKFIKPDEYVQI